MEPDFQGLRFLSRSISANNSSKWAKGLSMAAVLLFDCPQKNQARAAIRIPNFAVMVIVSATVVFRNHRHPNLPDEPPY